jgi:hypothetical protein
MLITQKYLQVKLLISQLSNHVTMVFNTVMKMFGVGDSYSRYMDYGLYKGCVANYLIISFCRRLVLQYILTIISNLLNTMSFWNNLHQVRSNLKDWKAK